MVNPWIITNLLKTNFLIIGQLLLDRALLFGGKTPKNATYCSILFPNRDHDQGNFNGVFVITHNNQIFIILLGFGL